MAWQPFRPLQHSEAICLRIRPQPDLLCGAQPIEMALDMCCGGRDGLNAQFAEAGAEAPTLPAVLSAAGAYVWAWRKRLERKISRTSGRAECKTFPVLFSASQRAPATEQDMRSASPAAWSGIHLRL